MPDPEQLWSFLPLGYLLTVAVELPVLYFALSPRHAPRERIVAGLWLTAVTYPIVVVALPLTLPRETSRFTYLLLAETFAPAAECGLFYLGYVRNRPEPDSRATVRDLAAVVLANLTSFAAGELWWRLQST